MASFIRFDGTAKGYCSECECDSETEYRKHYCALSVTTVPTDSAIFLFCEQNDVCGEGVRGDLYGFPNIEAAVLAFNSLRVEEEVTRIVMISGTMIRSYNP